MFKKRKKRKLNKILKKISISKKTKIIILLIFLFTIFSLSLKKFVLENPIFLIKNISISKKTIQTYINPKLEKEIVNNLSWKNILLVKLRKLKNIEKKIKNKRPIVKKIDINRNNKNKSIILDIKFHRPTIIFFNWKKYIWRYKNRWFDINKSSLFLKSWFYYLPEYTQNLSYLSWFWFETTPTYLRKQLTIIKKFFWNEKITYFPWWNITQITLSWNKKIIINNQQNLSIQLKKYLILKENFSWFNNLKFIDLWSYKNKIFIK